MASLLTCAVTSVSWCFCTAAASLLGSCCGNDKPSTTPPSETSGRKRSVLLLVLAIAASFAFQYGLAPYLVNLSISNYVTDSWTDECTQYDSSKELVEKCAGNAGVYRVAFATGLFYTLACIAAACKPTANREAWPAKYVLWVFLLAAMVFIPNHPLFFPIYLNLGRVGAVIFIVFQQVILIDLAYNWNESWVEKSNQQHEQRWLGAILVCCAVLYVGSIVGIALLYVYFNGCATNVAYITITLVLSIVVTVVQLMGEEASLLTSASIVAYATYLCYTAVSKNPNGECNPQLGDTDVLGIVLGVGLTLVGLAWTGWSYTAGTRVDAEEEGSKEEALVDEETGKDNDNKEEEERTVTGVVTGSSSYQKNDAPTNTEPTTSNDDPPKSFGLSWKLNLILLLVTCWFSMSLTGWGTIEAGGNAANPDVSRVSMWMIIASQWLMLTLYLWTLVAPKLFPDRDFS